MKNRVDKLIVVIEGTDGSGKETQSNLLVERLNEKYNNVEKVSFPNYESPACEPVKMYLAGELGTDPNNINPYAVSTMYAIDRFFTFKKDLENRLNPDNYILIADRYTSSNIVHQSAKIKNKVDRVNFIYWLQELEHGKFEIPKPTVTLFLDMPPEASKRLREGRANKITGEDKKDIHESNDTHIMEAYHNAKECAQLLRWKVIECVNEDGSIKSIEQINDEIFEKIKCYL